MAGADQLEDCDDENTYPDVLTGVDLGAGVGLG